jgi:hypothetical protein
VHWTAKAARPACSVLPCLPLTSLPLACLPCAASSCCRDLEIVMVNSLSPFGNGHLLPRGTLRELPKQALRRADAVVLHHVDLLGGCGLPESGLAVEAGRGGDTGLCRRAVTALP